MKAILGKLGTVYEETVNIQCSIADVQQIFWALHHYESCSDHPGIPSLLPLHKEFKSVLRRHYKRIDSRPKRTKKGNETKCTQ